MTNRLEISLLGELRVQFEGQDIALPASKKARALLGFLAATARPHRRERLRDLLWVLPDDPKAALRWALSKLRGSVNRDEIVCLWADRERVFLDATFIDVDVVHIQSKLLSRDVLSVADLEAMVGQLSLGFLEGLDTAGGDTFKTWIRREREAISSLRTDVYDRLSSHPELNEAQQEKWLRRLRNARPSNQFEGRAGTHGFVENQNPLNVQKIGFCQVSDGTKIAHATIGAGPPFVKAANWLSHLEYDWGSPIWGKTFGEIARNRTFIRYDERGCGLSDWTVKDLSLDAFVEDLDAVVRELGLKRFPLLGISQGCAVSIEYAVRYPERVSALILFGGYAAGWRHLASPEEQARREAVIKVTELGWGTDNPAYRHIFSQTFMPDACAKDLSWFDEFQRLTTSPSNAARFQEAFGRIDVRHRLAQVHVPTLVLHSRLDQRIPIEQGRAIAEGIKDAQFIPLDSRNHILVDSEPAWRTAYSAVARFLLEAGV